MPPDDCFVDEVFRWFYGTASDEKDASRKRALAWLETPNAKVAATRIGYGMTEAQHLLAFTRSHIVEAPSLPDWDTPSEAENDLREYLHECLGEER